MTRPKVDPDKRQRTAQACDSCKKRKQKCNGLKPCNTCSKRDSTCTYGDPDNGSDDQPSPKRRMTDNSHTNGGGSTATSPRDTHPPFGLQSPYVQQERRPAWSLPTAAPMIQSTGISIPKSVPEPSAFPLHMRALKKPSLIPAEDSHLLSRGTTASGHEEEAVVYSNTRMLQDPSGRLLYIGDSATLSFLQLIRMIVDNVSGPSSFTMDPRRHRFVENTIALPADMRRTHLLPDIETANVLVDAFFTNTNGLIEVFNHKSFLHTLQMCYADPLHVDPSWLCLLHLTLAIGLVMASPAPGSREDAIVRRLRSESIDRAEVFYADAKHLKDPMSASGFEDGGFWSVQALTLMAMYMLAVSKRNAAYALHGMAVRSAFSLGLHREETMCIFSGAEQIVRRNLLRSLYVLDRFISTSLGRPITIQESDCSGDTLTTGEKPPFPQAPFPTAANAGYSSGLGLEAAVRSCHVVGVILDRVYSQRKISTKMAQEIADNCKGWPKSLDPSLHWKQATSANPTQGIAILHVNLFYCHSIVLLTRPFFLYLMNKMHQEQREQGPRLQRQRTKMEKFGEACVVASCHSIVLVQNAREGRYLPHRNPFIIYFLFASALVVLSNEFSALFENPSANTCIENAISTMQYCAEHDPQASRLVFILTSFRDVVGRQKAATSTQSLSPSQLHLPHGPASQLFSQTMDLGDFFPDGTSASIAPSITATAGLSDHHQGSSVNPIRRHSSNPSISSPHPLEALQRPPSSHGPNGSNSNGSIQGMNTNGSAQGMNTNEIAQGMSGNSTSGNGTKSTDSPARQRQNSLDTFFDLARVSSNSADGNDSLGENEIDFESLWAWPSNGMGMGMGMGLTPGASGCESPLSLPLPLPSHLFPPPTSSSRGKSPSRCGGERTTTSHHAVGLTPNGTLNLLPANGVDARGVAMDVQGISDSSVPLFGMRNGEFGGN